MASESKGGGATPSLAEVQRRVSAYWTAAGVPAASLAAGGPAEFRFTEGPPTANGRPHVGHILSRALKDVHLRYRRMRGDKIVTAMGGWDCHGLPVEVEVEKRRGLKSKKEIEAYGVGRFCDECRQGAMEVAGVWRTMSERMAYWLDYDHAYFTMAAPYIESVWWSLKALHSKGLLEKGHYVLPYCPRCETPLASHEVAQGYRDATDPSVTVRIPLVEPERSPPRELLVWTTTPWTLPANLLIAAGADLEYVTVDDDGRQFVLAAAALPRYFPDAPTVVDRFPGSKLEDLEYAPLFPFAGAAEGRYRVVLDDFVDAKEGTGLVHVAPSFGPDDQRVGARERVGTFDPLDGRGVFTDRVPPVAGRSFKSADPVLLADLAARDRVFRAGTITHTYPFCWRCGTALLYRAIDSWFVRTSWFNAALVANNATVDWVPSYLRDGRFGNFLTEAKDWALSRNRYWGTPLPVWRCADGHDTVVGSFAELAERSGTSLPSDFDPHRMSVDPLILKCGTCGQPARREPYTIDSWYDSGSAPFAQYHHPFETGTFVADRPLDFVAEGLDQTRGWFYSMLVLSTALFERPAYRHCVVNGMILDDGGAKMSKSKGNVLDPLDLLERHGGDAVRWWFFLGDYTEPVRVQEEMIVRAGQRTLATLLNVLSFYRGNRIALPEARPPLPSPTGGLDRWLLSRLEATRAAVTAGLDAYDPHSAALALRSFVDDLSTWYLRRSRPRFWEEAVTDDRREADATLAYALTETSRLLAPFAPHTAEYVFQEVTGEGFLDAEASVHLTGWPSLPSTRDPSLEAAMQQTRALAEVGRELRQRVGVKNRIPLEELVVAERADEPPLDEELRKLLADELNVHRVRLVPAGPAGEVHEPGFARRDDGERLVAAISSTPSEAMVHEGWVRESMRHLQRMRKSLGLAYTQPVELELWTDEPLARTLESSRDRLAKELLATRLTIAAADPPDAGLPEFDVDDHPIRARMRSRATA